MKKIIYADENIYTLIYTDASDSPFADRGMLSLNEQTVHASSPEEAALKFFSDIRGYVPEDLTSEGIRDYMDQQEFSEDSPSLLAVKQGNKYVLLPEGWSESEVTDMIDNINADNTDSDYYDSEE